MHQTPCDEIFVLSSEILRVRAVPNTRAPVYDREVEEGDFSYLHDRVEETKQLAREDLILSEVLIKSVVQAIPRYAMSVLLLSSSIARLVRNFWFMGGGVINSRRSTGKWWEIFDRRRVKGN